MCNFDSGEFRMFLKMIMSSYFRWVAEYWFVSTPALEPFFSSKTHVALEIKSFQINMDVNVTKFTCTVWHMLLYFTRTYYFSFGFDRVTCRAVMIQDRSKSHCQIVFFFFNRNCANENRCDSFKAAPTLGRPKDNFNVWVMGEVQVNNLGEVVPEDAREYVYVQELTASRIKPPEVVLPFKKEALNGVFSSLKDTIHHNYMGGLVAVGKN